MTDGDPRTQVLKHLAPLLRYHHMTSDFLANVVCSCPLMAQSGLLPSVLASALVQRDASPALVQARGAASGAPNRGKPLSDARWKFTVIFPLTELAAVRQGRSAKRTLGYVAGYPVSAVLMRQKDDDTLQVRVCVSLDYLMATVNHRLSQGLAGGVGFKIGIQIAPAPTQRSSEFLGLSDRVIYSPFAEPWEQLVRGDHPFFPEGKMEF